MKSRRELDRTNHETRWCPGPVRPGLVALFALLLLAGCRTREHVPWTTYPERPSLPERTAADPIAPVAEDEPALVLGEAAATEQEAPDVVVPDPLDSPAPLAPPEIAEIDRTIWLAGRETVGGLSAVRAQERAQERARALLRVEDGLAAFELWSVRLEAILSRSVGDAELYRAAARTAGALGLYDYASALIAALERRRDREWIAAQEGVHAMFGEWFTSAEEALPFLVSIEPGPGTKLLLARGREAEELARERLVDAVRDRPVDALEYVDDADARVRTVVAEVLGRALTAPADEPPAGDERAQILATLLERLERELDPRAFHASLVALVGALENADVEAPELVKLRHALFRIARMEGDCRTPSVAWGIARLPWTDTPASGRASLGAAVEVVGDVLVGLSAADLRRGIPDPDPTLLSLQALQILCERAAVAGQAEELRRSRARQPVFDLVQDAGRSAVVRATAGAALGAFALPEDGPYLIQVLADGDAAPSVSHAVLGALHTLLLEFEPEAPGAAALMREIAVLSGARDPDLRRRSLALLADEALEPHVRRLDTRFLVERFATEEVPDLSRTIIGLLRRYGRYDVLEPIVSSQRFAELARSDPAIVAELTEMVRVLARGRARESMHAARRLADVPAEETRLLRTQSALSIVSVLSEAEALELSAQEHRTISAWAWQLHVAGVDLTQATPQGVDFVERLVRIHWPQAGVGHQVADPERVFGEPARHHLLAVCLGILALQERSRVSVDEAEKAFSRALRLAPTHAGAEGALVPVRRDRARFRTALGQSVMALADYRALVDRDALEIPDLRTAISLLESIGGATPAGRRAIAPETFDLLGRLVGRPTWFVEPATVRMQDLKHLAESAIRSGDGERMELFVATMSDLPAEPPTRIELETTPPLWSGLAREPQGLEDLQVLRDRVAVALSGLSSEG